MTNDVGNKLEGQIAKAAPAERKTARDLIATMEGEFARALPATLKVDRFMRVAMTEIRQTPELGTCSGDSLLGALVTAAQLGLEPGGPLGEYYLTPRTLKGQGKVVVPIIGYQGLLTLARRGGVGQIDARIVREGDRYNEGFDTERGFFAEWHPQLDDTRTAIGVLAAARLPGGDVQHRYLAIDEVLERKARGAAGDRGPWATDFEAMARKTGLRALAPRLPRSAELAHAVRVDETVQTYRPGVDVLPLGELESDEGAG
ncbi:recombinase RecT [Georgenia sp. MJ170]|uniref:recombinase RecT n=1 Tax=Georgenia sunbinii TaxID=3117728 RepID=UPI002F2662BD